AAAVAVAAGPVLAAGDEELVGRGRGVEGRDIGAGWEDTAGFDGGGGVGADVGVGFGAAGAAGAGGDLQPRGVRVEDQAHGGEYAHHLFGGPFVEIGEDE